MKKMIPKIAAIEIPVSNLEVSINWYVNILGLNVQYRGSKDAMLNFTEKGVPGILLCETEAEQRLSFLNTNTGVTHSIIDFYTDELEKFYAFLINHEVEVSELKLTNGYGGFGFKDPDGNSLGACNIG